jgi:hypothetical protein
MRRDASLVTAAVLLVAALAACAADGLAVEPDEFVRDAGGAHSPADARADTGALPIDAGFDGAAAEDAASAEDAARDEDAAPTEDAGTTPPDAASASCAAAETCQSAADVGSVSGDKSSPSQTVTGVTSKWVRVKVSEDDGTLIARKVRVSATLESPAAENFDLYAYVDTSGSPTTRACGASSAESTNGIGQTDVISLSWGEGEVPNGSDDGRIVSFEVRATSSACDPNATWTLTISGNAGN